MARSFGSAVVEVEFDANNCSVHFPPLDRRLRGRFSFVAMGNPEALQLVPQWGETIPGQRIVLDADARAAKLVEPLHRADYGRVREAIARRGQRLEQAEQEYADVDVGTWVFWLKRCVDGGLARIVSGMFPANPGEPKLPRSYRISQDSGGDLVQENKDLRSQLTEMREQLAELRGMMLAKK